MSSVCSPLCFPQVNSTLTSEKERGEGKEEAVGHTPKAEKTETSSRRQPHATVRLACALPLFLEANVSMPAPFHLCPFFASPRCPCFIFPSTGLFLLRVGLSYHHLLMSDSAFFFARREPSARQLQDLPFSHHHSRRQVVHVLLFLAPTYVERAVALLSYFSH